MSEREHGDPCLSPVRKSKDRYQQCWYQLTRTTAALNHYDRDISKRRIARSSYKCELSPSSLDQGICNKHDEKPEF
jgi:hypothetical protein